MAEDKKSFILYADIIGIVEKLPDEKAGQLFKIILNYVNDNDPIIEDLLLQIAFEPIKLTLKRDLKKWENYIEKQRENGKRGGRPKNPTDEEKTQKTQPFFSKPKKADSVSVSDNVNVSVNVKENTKEKFDFKKSIMCLGVFENLANDFLQVRKNKKMTNTETAFNAIKKEIEKTKRGAAECIEIAVVNGWGGFKSEWIKDKTENNGTTTKQNNASGFTRKDYDPNNGIGDGTRLSDTKKPKVFSYNISPAAGNEQG